MQGMNKIEQQDSTSQNLQVEVKKLIGYLESGKKSAHMMRSLILQNNPRVKVENDDDQHQDHNKALLLDHHSMVCLDTYASSLSMLKTFDFDKFFARKRKQEHLGEVDDAISEESTDVGSPNMSNTVNGGRESNKRRKINGESREVEVSHLTDDGFPWRKYGQKLILNSHYPRHYYRCTHRNDQKCQATKQVQQLSENPTKYKLIYHYNHTCNTNIVNTSSYMVYFPEDHPSGFFLSFDQSNQVNPMLFPESTFPAAVATVNPTSPSTSSNYNHSISQDTTVTTTSTDGLSSNSFSELSMVENCSSTASSVNLEEDDYSFIMADFSDYTLPDWWTNKSIYLAIFLA